jgi:hypothetical protein
MYRRECTFWILLVLLASMTAYVHQCSTGLRESTTKRSRDVLEGPNEHKWIFDHGWPSSGYISDRRVDFQFPIYIFKRKAQHTINI